jgi:tRNA ligase
MEDALSYALHSYAPDIRQTISSGKPSKAAQKAVQKALQQQQQQQQQTSGAASSSTASTALINPKQIEYFCVRLPTSLVVSVLDHVFASQPPTTARFYRQLQATRRMQASLHVTLVHRASAKEHHEVWERLVRQYGDTAVDGGSLDQKLGTCRVQLERVVWDDRIMAVVARLLDEGWETTNRIAHVTIGTVEPAVKPKESNDLLARWLENGSGDDKGVWEVELGGSTRTVVDGEVRVVLTNFGMG